MERCVLIHYGEISLKGKNRAMYEENLLNQLRQRLSVLGDVQVRRISGRFLASFRGDMEIDEHLVSDILKNVFGVIFFIFAWKLPFVYSDDVEPFFEKVADELLNLAEKLDFKTFCVRCSRSDKSLPFTSESAERLIGGRMLRLLPNKKVSLKTPDMTFHADFIEKFVFIYANDRIPGSGGMPVGSSGKLLTLISGGFDSPVASYYMMKRGAHVSFVHFHSYPATQRASIENVQEIVSRLSRYEFGTRLYLVPFLNIQKAIVAKCEAKYRVLLYRRAMIRIAEMIAQKYKMLGLVTGESVAQVASQTLHNMAAVDAAATMPIYRPLVGFDKSEIIDVSRKLGLDDLSGQQFEDCCSMFMPAHPETHAKIDLVEIVEAGGKYDALLEEALKNVEVVKY